MTFPPLSVMHALAALAVGTELILRADNICVVQVGPRFVLIPDSDLAELTTRNWICFADDDDTGTPTCIILTDQGKYALRRYLQKHKTEIRLNTLGEEK